MYEVTLGRGRGTLEPLRLEIQSYRPKISVNHAMGLQDPVAMIENLVDKNVGNQGAAPL